MRLHRFILLGYTRLLYDTDAHLPGRERVNNSDHVVKTDLVAVINGPRSAAAFNTTTASQQ